MQPQDKVLELGSGTGYVTVCLCRLGGEVVGIEPDPDLAAAARQHLSELGCTGVKVLELDPLAGPAPGGPFDAIAVLGSLPSEADLGPLERQLAVGGRLFGIVGEPPVMGAHLVTRVGPQDFRRERLFETSAAPLVLAPRVPDFVF